MKNVLPKLTNTALRKAAMLLIAGSALSSISTKADIVYVTTYIGGTLQTCSSAPPVCYLSGTYSTFGGAGGASVADAPARSRYTYGYSSDFSWSIQPTLGTAGGTYQIEIAHPTFSSTSADALVTVTSPDGVLSASCVNTPVFNSGYSGSAWHLVGTIDLNDGVTSPVLTFTVSGGTVGPTSSANRLNVDAFKFTDIGDPCIGVSPAVTIGGPLVANTQQYVVVRGVDAAATAVTVYVNGFESGTLTSGIVAGDNTVPIDFPLIFGSQIKATQTKGGCVSPLPSSGPIVGGGANPPLVKAFLSLGKNSALAGPIGAHTTNAFASTYTLKMTGLVSGSQSAPIGGQDILPSQCWETVTFTHGVDGAKDPNNGADVTAFDAFAALDALVFAIDSAAPDTGPYDIYIDRIMNGDVVIEDFESYTVGGLGLFKNPNGAATPNPAAAYLSAPNSSVISTDNAFDGTKSCRIRWQFANNSEVRWARILANATAGKHYPQIDTTKPVSIRYLVLPVGQTEDKTTYPTPPATQTKGIGESVTFDVTASGDGPFSYQWNYEGNPIPDATTSSYTKSNLVVEDSGTYSVTVSGATCISTLNAGLTVSEVVEPPTLNYSKTSTDINFTWSGNFMLQSRTAVDTGTWTDINATGAYSEPLNSSSTKFFRLRQN